MKKYIQGRYMKEMKFIGFSVSFVMIHDKELLLGDKGMLFEHEFHYIESSLKQFRHAVHLCPILSCPHLLHVCALLPAPRVLED